MRIFGVYVSYETIMLALIVVFVLSLIAQGKVKRVFNRYNTVPAARNVPAYQAAQEMLLDNGSAVTVHPVQGTLTDHYDPRNDTVGLSTEVYNSTSVAALAIAAHEIGHVLQYQENYAPIRWRTAILPTANLGATFGPYMILIGLLMNIYPLAVIGLALYGAMFLFQLVTLPVEFNASQRGLELLDRGGYIDYSNRADAQKVLNAAAWTYVLAALGSLLSFLRFFMLVNGNRRRN
jgi:Zn-dependent membrane protease YugP